MVYVYREDVDESLLVGIFAGRHQKDEDFECSLSQMKKLDLAATRRGAPLVYILVSDRDVEAPSPKWRGRIAATNRTLTSGQFRFAFVTPSAVTRGIFTAVNWLSNWPPGHVTSAFSDFGAACTWVRLETGKRYPHLEAMYMALRQALEQHPEGE